MTAAPIEASRARLLAQHATPGRAASFAMHVVLGAALLALPRVTAPHEPQVVRIEVVPPPVVEPPPPPEPKRRARTPQPPVKPRPQAPADAEPLLPLPLAARAPKLSAASAVAAKVADADDNAPFMAAPAERADDLRAATAKEAPLAAAQEDAPWIGASAERADQLPGPAPQVAPRELSAAKAAPEEVQFASTETPPDEAKKRAEDEARRQAALNAPKADRGDAPIAAGSALPPPAGGGASGGGGAPAAGGGVRAAIRGITVDGLGEPVGCANPDDVRLSEDERAACNRRRWAGARGAPELGAVGGRNQRIFDAAAARKNPPTGAKPVAACARAGAQGALDCLPAPDAPKLK